ncbi:MAG: hypothetical protein JRD88_02895 [Deltaproteobacteria bacterium]|jgi:hypothetical protein|nr:hypothetical protein [Deltaproteobacteria bacterium]
MAVSVQKTVPEGIVLNKNRCKAPGAGGMGHYVENMAFKYGLTVYNENVNQLESTCQGG